jgi:hypothetical protein
MYTEEQRQAAASSHSRAAALAVAGHGVIPATGRPARSPPGLTRPYPAHAGSILGCSLVPDPLRPVSSSASPSPPASALARHRRPLAPQGRP